MRRCRPPQAGWLVEAVAGGDGVLLWLRTTDAIPRGELPMLGVRDTITAPGAIVAVRYMTGELTHGYALDSGSVSVNDSGAVLDLRIVGSGLETPGGFRPFFEAALSDVAVAASTDTISCEPLR